MPHNLPKATQQVRRIPKPVTSGELEVTIQATQGQVEGTGRGKGRGSQDMSSMQENHSSFQSAIF